MILKNECPKIVSNMFELQSQYLIVPSRNNDILSLDIPIKIYF